MKRLLNQQPEKRLGGSYANLKTHKWFRHFDFVNNFPCLIMIFFYIGCLSEGKNETDLYSGGY
jgi:hypothetical protein